MMQGPWRAALFLLLAAACGGAAARNAKVTLLGIIVIEHAPVDRVAP